MTLRAAFSQFRHNWSLAGRLLAIVFLILVVDFGINSVLFERENAQLINAEEAARVAEHVLVARQVLNATPPDQRTQEAKRLSTDRFRIGWLEERTSTPDPRVLDSLRKQLLGAEQSLSAADVRLRIVPVSAGGGIAGSALLDDGTALVFRTTDIVSSPLNIGMLIRFSLPSLVLLAITGWLVTRSFRPLNGLVTATAKVGLPDMDPLPETGQPEVRQLIRAFNAMHDRIHQLLVNRTQTLLAIGHDLRTPMARLQLRLDGARIDETTRDEMSADIGEMSELLDSLHAYVQSGEEGGPAERVDLVSLIRTQVDEASDRGLPASYTGPDRLAIETHALGIRRAVSNLIQNALRYAGSVEVSLATDRNRVAIVVADRGPGIPEDQLEQVIQPFIRLDRARARNTRGMGLGLAIVDRIVSAEGGELTLVNRPGGGLIATITLPFAPAGKTL